MTLLNAVWHVVTVASDNGGLRSKGNSAVIGESVPTRTILGRFLKEQADGDKEEYSVHEFICSEAR